MTSELLVRPAGSPADDGTLVSVTPESAGWGHVGFEVLELDDGVVARRSTTGRELCVVVVAGRCRVSSEHGDWDIGGRPDPFSGPPPIYPPAPIQSGTLPESAVDQSFRPCRKGGCPRTMLAACPSPIHVRCFSPH